METKPKKVSSVIVLERALIKSDAFKPLGRIAIKVLLNFMGKRVMKKKRLRKDRNDEWAIGNNGEITYTYAEAEKQGISRPSFARALDELIKYGFIDIAKTGAGLFKLATYYSISKRWQNWGNADFIHKERMKKKRYHKGIGFQKGHKFSPNRKEVN